MGTDNLFHKRKERSKQALARRKARRERYDKVLIVCEGGKTEPNYFEGLKNHHKLSSANIEITGDCGSSPANILEHARQLYREEKDAGDPFDRVYCVFDKDSHESYQRTCQAIEAAKPKETFHAITSVPCFEYWLLLHFESTTRPYQPLPGNSAGNQLLGDLKRYMPDYTKGQKEVFETLLGQLPFAKANAERSLAAAAANYTDNPSTKVHLLVSFLQSVKK